MFSDQEVLEEVAKIQYLYALKHEIRYAEVRADNTESVAEHIYGMHICAMYFLPLENPLCTWDKSRIFQMITLHDIDEIETGDVIGYTKTQERRDQEANAMRTVMQKSSLHMQNCMSIAIDEYEAQQTKESQFVKAIDKIEPCLQLYNQNGRKILLQNKTTLEQHISIRYKNIAPFSIIHHFYNVLTTTMQNEGFFTEEA